MRLKPYEVRALHRLPPDARNAVHAAANAHEHRKRHRKEFRAFYSAAVTAVEINFAPSHQDRVEEVHRELVALRLTPDFPDCDKRWGQIPAKDRDKLNDTLDALDLTGHALGTARAVLRRLARALEEVGEA